MIMCKCKTKTGASKTNPCHVHGAELILLLGHTLLKRSVTLLSGVGGGGGGVESISRLLWFCFTAFYDWLEKFAQAKPKPTVTWSHAFSRAWRRLHEFASDPDWFIALFTSAVLGQRNYFGLVLRHSVEPLYSNL